MSKCVVIGAGPAGLTAAYELAKQGATATVIEADRVVGGISRTCEYRGYRFDIGGHRFFTKVPYVRELWEEILGDEFITRPRLSRIYYAGRFFDYPLKPLNAVVGLGALEALRIGASYLRARLLPNRDEHTFEHWVSNRFGRRLFEIFFKTYTEKVWGMPCAEISADWASQRIRNLDLTTALKDALLGKHPSRKSEAVSSLIEEFQYPRLGPGQMWETCAARLENLGTKILLGARVGRVVHKEGRIQSLWIEDDGAGYEVRGDEFISSMPIRDLIRSFDPPPPPAVLAAAERLRYRDFLTVVLIVEREDLFRDTWIYIHSGDVRVGRIQNFKNWSPAMVPDAGHSSLGLEYFVQENDELWSAADADLIELGRRECSALGLCDADRVVDATVVRMPKAYPVYDRHYQDALETIRGYVGSFPNLQLIGRNGQHRYNNQDHSMMTGVYAARNLRGASHDVWSVNVEDDYLEYGGAAAAGERLVPAHAEPESLDALVAAAFARYDAIALGVAVAAIAGFGLFLATITLLLRGGDPIGPNLSLLGVYLFGYSVSWGGAGVGLVEGAAGGFAFGWILAGLLNWVIRAEERRLLARAELAHAMDRFRGE